MDPDRYGNDRMGCYTGGKFLGSGNFANVYSYSRKSDGLPVAIKAVKREEKERGVNLGAVKEIQVLLEIRHCNIITLHDVFPLKGMIYMVLEKAVTDLDGLIQDRTLVLSIADVKSLMKMFLEGLAHMHDHWFMHRDLKPENLLIVDGGVLKLADLGHATTLGTDRDTMFHNVVTIWYRPPELLFKAPFHTEAVDIWSAGCIFAEMILRQAIFRCGPGSEEDQRVSQLAQIVRILGTPDPSSWKGIDKLEGYVEFPFKAPEPWAAVFPELDKHGLDLIDRMLQYNPSDRISAREALSHPFFSTAPDPTPPAEIPLGKRVFDAIAVERAEAEAAAEAAERATRKDVVTITFT